MGSRIAARVLFVGVVLFVTSTRADVSGSFDGSVTSKARADAVAISAALSITGRTVAGTVALPSDLPVIGGAYLVHGVATRKRVNVSGTGATGGRFTWKAKIAGDTLRGKMRVKGPGAKLAGTLTMNRNVSTTDGSGCDAVFTANQTFFVDQVLPALAACASCHAPGLQAQAARLHVLPGDPLATARTIAQLVDAADPDASRILRKPLNLVPHGGGAQLVVGSPQEEVLAQWVALVAEAHCN